MITGLTIFIAGLGANFEYDLKKIIALSTLRQLGLIERIVSIGFPKLIYFHLSTQALFRAFYMSEDNSLRAIGGENSESRSVDRFLDQNYRYIL